MIAVIARDRVIGERFTTNCADQRCLLLEAILFIACHLERNRRECDGAVERSRGWQHYDIATRCSHEGIIFPPARQDAGSFAEVPAHSIVVQTLSGFFDSALVSLEALTFLWRCAQNDKCLAVSRRKH